MNWHATEETRTQARLYNEEKTHCLQTIVAKLLLHPKT